MNVLITDPQIADRIRAEREATDGSQYDEVWDGVYVMTPFANLEHQDLAFQLAIVIHSVLSRAEGDLVYTGANVSDREEGWTHNFRVPDIAVFLRGTRARAFDAHWCGGPDFVVEILSPGDLAREKRPFYAQIGVRELLLIDRKPWALELYRLEEGELKQVGRSSLDQSEILTSTVLPLSFHLVPGPGRPQIEVRRNEGDDRWLV